MHGHFLQAGQALLQLQALLLLSLYQWKCTCIPAEVRVQETLMFFAVTLKSPLSAPTSVSGGTFVCIGTANYLTLYIHPACRN